MTALEKLLRAEAILDLLRVSLANDFCAALDTNVGLTVVEAKQQSGVEACELAMLLIVEARREFVLHLARSACAEIV